MVGKGLNKVLEAIKDTLVGDLIFPIKVDSRYSKSWDMGINISVEFKVVISLRIEA